MARGETDHMARLVAPVEASLRRGAVLAVLANLAWGIQAAAIAAGLSALLAPAGVALSPTAAAVLFLAGGALRAGLDAAAGGVLWRAADRVIGAHRARILDRESQDGPGAGAGGPGAIAALATDKLDLLAPWITRFAPARARAMVVPLFILVPAFVSSWAMGLVFLITGPLIPLFMALVGWAAQAASERQMEEVASLSELTVDRIGALGDMRLIGARERIEDDFAARAEGLRARTMAVLRVAFLSSTTLELFAAIGVAMVAVFSGFSLLGAITWGSWGRPLTPFEVTFLLVLAPEFYQPMRDLAAAWHDRAAAAAVAGELAAWEAADRAPGLGSGAAAAPLDGVFSLRLTGVVLRRGDTRIAVPDIALGPGESLAVTGPSGVGKTTLLMALAGLIVPEAGRIEVAGQPLDDTSADGWRARLGWMPQAPHFLDRTLADNVAMGRPGEIGPALTAAHVAPVVAALAEGTATRLGETGAGLSGGEARRVTLARALHGHPELILADEPTADLDAATAVQVTQALIDEAARGTALLLATHDPALAARCTRAIELGGDDG